MLADKRQQTREDETVGMLLNAMVTALVKCRSGLGQVAVTVWYLI